MKKAQAQVRMSKNTNFDQDEVGSEPGEILSSDDEAVDSTCNPVQQPSTSANRAVISSVKDKSSHVGKSYAKFQHLKDDPEFNDFLDNMLDRKLSNKTTDHTENRTTRGESAANIQDIGKNNNSNRAMQKPHLVKSPSDTTLYTPGLALANTQQQRDNNAIDKISNFVESIRIDGSAPNRRNEGVNDRDSRQNSIRISSKRSEIPHAAGRTPPSSKRAPFHDATQKEVDSDPELETEKATEHLLLQAEKFKARVEAPKGMVKSMLMPYDYDRLRSKFVTAEGLAPIDSEILFLRNFDQDDEFFHVTSQIDPSLRNKIERGEFIDLDRLLPKDKFSSGLRGGHDDLNRQLFQLITQGSNSYMNPPEPRGSNRINTLKKWDQAFRVFAAIYTQANPSRASEIWQYVYVIHTAAASNPWENVSFYDITFRELMASKPWRNWGKTYNQGWNMAFNNNNNYSHGTYNSGYNGGGGSTSSYASSNSNNNNRSWKDDCCWRYNKNRCKKPANECRYHHRCTHCAGWNHSHANCKKRNNRGNNNNGKSNNWMTYNNNTKASPVKNTDNKNLEANNTKN